MKIDHLAADMHRKETYMAFCEGRNDLPLFMQPYWLDLVCREVPWDVVLSFDPEGNPRGAWAYQPGTRLGLQTIRLPVLTPFTGIWMDIPQGLTPQKQIALRHQILNDLLDQIPDAHIFELKVHWSLQDWLPMYWRGYRQETRYTFRFPEIRVDDIYDNFSKSLRRNLRAAERRYSIQTGTGAEMYPLVENVFKMQREAMPVSRVHFEEVVQVMTSRGQAQIHQAVDSTGVRAAVLTVWDQDTTYNLLSGRTISDSKTGTNLLLWHAIQEAAKRGHAFDFEGSMIHGVNVFFQAFGATLTPYLYLYKYRGPARLKYLSGNAEFTR